MGAAAVISVIIGRNLVLLREMGVRIGLRYRLEVNGRGWLCIFGAFPEGCIVWRLVGLGAFFTLGM